MYIIEYNTAPLIREIISDRFLAQKFKDYIQLDRQERLKWIFVRYAESNKLDLVRKTELEELKKKENLNPSDKKIIDSFSLI